MSYDAWKLMTPEEDAPDEACDECGRVGCECMGIEMQVDARE